MIGNASKLMCWPDRLAAYWASSPVIPVTVEIQVTNRCNQSCVYCPGGSAGDMSQRELAVIMAQCSELGVGGLVFSGGGEPLLSGAMRCRKHLPSGLITNGSIPMPREFWAQFDWVRFSVDSCVPEEYQAIRGVPMPECLEPNIRAAARVTTAGVQAVVTGLPVDLDKLARFAKDCGAEYLHIRPREGAVPGFILPVSPVDGLEIISRSDKFRKQTGRCVAGNFIMTIAPDLKCYVCACAGARRVLVGDLTEETLRDVVMGERRVAALGHADTALCPPGCKGLGINLELESCWKHSLFL